MAKKKIDLNKTKSSGWLDNYSEDFSIDKYPEGGGVQPIIVNSKNDPRYRAYQDSLFIHKQEMKYNEKLKELKDKYPYNLLKRGEELDKFEQSKDFKNNIEAQERLNYSLRKDKNYIFTDGGKEYYSRTEKPIQPVIYQPNNTFKDNKGNIVSSGINKPTGKPQLVQMIKRNENVPQQLNPLSIINTRKIPEQDSLKVAEPIDYNQNKLNLTKSLPLEEGTYFTRENQLQEIGGKRYVDKKTGKLIGEMKNGNFEYNPLWLEMNPDLRNEVPIDKYADGDKVRGKSSKKLNTLTPESIKDFQLKASRSFNDPLLSPGQYQQIKNTFNISPKNKFDKENFKSKEDELNFKANRFVKDNLTPQATKENAKNKKIVKEAFDNAKDFFTKYYESPRHYEMLHNSLHNIHDLTNIYLRQRVDNLLSTSADFKRDYSEDENTGGYSESLTGDISVLPGGLRMRGGDISELLTHELSHSTDRPYLENPINNIFTDFKTMIPYRINPAKGLFKDLTDYSNLGDEENDEIRVIPLKDINEINSDRLGLKDSEYYKDKNITEEKFNEFYKDYVGDPTEVRARLMEIRKTGYDNKIYDPLKKKVTPENYKQLKDFLYKKHKINSPIFELEQLYKEPKVIKLLNEISENNTNEEIPIAKDGGFTSKKREVSDPLLSPSQVAQMNQLKKQQQLLSSKETKNKIEKYNLNKIIENSRNNQGSITTYKKPTVLDKIKHVANNPLGTLSGNQERNPFDEYILSIPAITAEGFINTAKNVLTPETYPTLLKGAANILPAISNAELNTEYDPIFNDGSSEKALSIGMDALTALPLSNYLKPGSKYLTEFVQGSRAAGKFKRPEYVSVMRVEPKGFNPSLVAPHPSLNDVQKTYTGAWLQNASSKTPNAFKELKAYVSGIEEKARGPKQLLADYVPYSKAMKQTGKNLPYDAKIMSFGAGDYGTLENALSNNAISRAEYLRLKNYNNSIVQNSPVIKTNIQKDINRIRPIEELYNPNEMVNSKLAAKLRQNPVATGSEEEIITAIKNVEDFQKYGYFKDAFKKANEKAKKQIIPTAESNNQMQHGGTIINNMKKKIKKYPAGGYLTFQEGYKGFGMGPELYQDNSYFRSVMPDNIEDMEEMINKPSVFSKINDVLGGIDQVSSKTIGFLGNFMKKNMTGGVSSPDSFSNYWDMMSQGIGNIPKNIKLSEESPLNNIVVNSNNTLTTDEPFNNASGLLTLKKNGGSVNKYQNGGDMSLQGYFNYLTNQNQNRIPSRAFNSNTNRSNLAQLKSASQNDFLNTKVRKDRQSFEDDKVDWGPLNFLKEPTGAVLGTLSAVPIVGDFTKEALGDSFLTRTGGYTVGQGVGKGALGAAKIITAIPQGNVGQIMSGVGDIGEGVGSTVGNLNANSAMSSYDKSGYISGKRLARASEDFNDTMGLAGKLYGTGKSTFDLFKKPGPGSLNSFLGNQTPYSRGNKKNQDFNFLMKSFMPNLGGMSFGQDGGYIDENMFMVEEYKNGGFTKKTNTKINNKNKQVTGWLDQL